MKMISCCCGFGKKEEPENAIIDEIIPRQNSFLKLEFSISSARTPVASPRSEISIDEIILVESEKLEVSESSEELVALPKSKAIVEHVTRGLSKLLLLKTLNKKYFSCGANRPRQNPAKFFLLCEQNNEPARQFYDCYFKIFL